MAITFVISNRKGGTGKTTVSVNLAAELAALGLRVLLVDLDSQGHCAVGLGIKVGKGTPTVHDLPGMDGLTLTRKLKTEERTRGIRIVAVTCYPEHYPKDAALAAGCDAYLLKPINTRELSDQLTAVAEGGDAVN